MRRSKHVQAVDRRDDILKQALPLMVAQLPLTQNPRKRLSLVHRRGLQLGLDNDALKAVLLLFKEDLLRRNYPLLKGSHKEFKSRNGF
jgi:hypothetical protein